VSAAVGAWCTVRLHISLTLTVTVNNHQIFQTMAKNNLSAEILETVLERVMEKFTVSIQTIVTQFSTAITDIVSGRLEELALSMKNI
jgi:hypothetical protein